jgi:tetratricopeptide (TPR) repeat protein
MHLYRPILLNLCLLAPVSVPQLVIANAPVARYTSVSDDDGGSARALYRKGLRMQRSGRLDEAQQYFEGAIKINTHFADAYLALAGVYRLQQQPEPARRQLQTVLQLQPSHGGALAALAALHYEQRSWEDALACAFRAQELGERQMNRLIGLSYAHLDHPAEAAQALERAREEERLEGEDLCSMARLYAQLEQYEKSVQCYEESLKAGGNPPAVYYELGMMHFNMKNYKHAAGAFEKAARLGRPADADLYLNLGMAHLKQAAYGEAIANLQTALSLRPKDIQVMLNLANACYKQQDFQQAATLWNKILMLQPQNAFAMFMLGKSYMGCGELVKGQAICDQALAMGEK